MIFITVGTHEQQFNRLVKEVDLLKKEEIISEDVFVQTGYSDYKPMYCNWKDFLTYEEMQMYMEKSSIVVTHGGPASFMQVISFDKKPIVVPRQLKFGEHVNDHQIDFAKKVVRRGYPIILITNVTELKDLLNLDFRIHKIDKLGNNQKFNHKLSALITNLLSE